MANTTTLWQMSRRNIAVIILMGKHIKEVFVYPTLSFKDYHNKNPYLSWLVCSVFRVTPKAIYLVFSLYFAMEEINSNLDILPNISLLVNIECNLMSDDEKTGLSVKRKELIPNYTCINQRRYLIVLTGPSWSPSMKLGRYLYISRTPEVSQSYFSGNTISL